MFSSRFQELKAAVKACKYSTQNDLLDEMEAFELAAYLIFQCQLKKGTVYVIGNGGSAGIASHFSNDLMKALKIPSQTLFDSNLMTCLSNDIGYENVFSYPLERLLKPNDLLVSISSSGKSPNIIKAAEVALEKDIPLITLSGFLYNNPLRQLGRLNFWVDQSDYGLVETSHFFLLHTIIDLYTNYLKSRDCSNKAPQSSSVLLGKVKKQIMVT